MAKKKLYKSVLKVIIISDEPYPDSVNLDHVKYDITDGHCSGILEWDTLNAEVVGAEAVKEMHEQGSDVEFFQMDEEGNDLEEDY